MSDFSFTAGSVVPSSQATKEYKIAGVAISGGDQLYLDTSTTPNTVKLADGNDATKMPVYGMASNTAGIGQTVQVTTKDPNCAIGTHGLGLGIPMFMSATAGKTCPLADLATGNLTTSIFVTNTATTISYNPTGGVGAHV